MSYDYDDDDPNGWTGPLCRNCWDTATYCGCDFEPWRAVLKLIAEGCESPQEIAKEFLKSKS